MLLTYLPLIMLSQLLLVSLLFNIFLFRQNRNLIKTNKAIEKISKKQLFSEHAGNVAISPTEDLTLFIPQPIFKVKPSAPASIIEAPPPIIEPAASIIELPLTKSPTEKSTFDDIHRLLNEISQIEHKMGLKDETEKAS